MIRFVWGERVGELRYFGIRDGRDGLWFVGIRRPKPHWIRRTGTADLISRLRRARKQWEKENAK